MKTRTIPRNIGLILLLSTITTFYVAQPSSCFAQGSLTPPGAPAPTMKSLDGNEMTAGIGLALATAPNLQLSIKS